MLPKSRAHVFNFKSNGILIDSRLDPLMFLAVVCLILFRLILISGRHCHIIVANNFGFLLCLKNGLLNLDSDGSEGVYIIT